MDNCIDNQATIIETDIFDSKYYFDVFLDNSPNSICVLDKTGLLIRINQAGLDLLHISNEDVVGKYNVLEDNIVMEQGKMPLVKAVFDQGKSVKFLLNYNTAKLETIELEDTVQVIIEVVIFPILSKKGEIISVIIQHNNITDYVDTQKELSKSKELFKNLFDQSTIGKAIIDLDGRMITVNKSLENVLGYTTEELQTSLLSIFTYKDDISKNQEIFRCLLANERSEYRLEKRYICKSGQLLWCDESHMLYKDETGKPLYFISSMIDITRQKNSELEMLAFNETLEQRVKERTETLTISQENFKQLSAELNLIIDTLPALIFYKDTKNNFIRVNKYIADAHMTTKENLEGKSLFDLYPKDIAQQYWDDDLDVIKSGQSIINVEESRDVGDNQRWLLTSKILDRNAKDEVVGIVGVSIDITDNKKTEQKLSDLVNINQKIMDESPIGIFACSSDGPCVIANPAVARISGTTLENMRSLNFRNLDSWKKNGLFDLVENVLETGIEQKLENHIKTTFGRDSWLEFSISRFTYQNKPHFLMLVDDITTRKNQDETLKIAFSRLEKLTEDLKTSNKELDDFAYISSHDLREPLRGINNYSKFLLEDYEDKLDDEGKNMLITICKLTVRLEQFIDSLLHFSRLGRTAKVTERVSLKEIIDEVLESFDFAIHERPTVIKILENQPIIECDRLRTSEIYKNLIGNALKYNSKPERVIEIGYLIENQDLTSPVLYVRDNGIGIEKVHMDSVFTIFKRLHTRDKFGGGTGAGLTIVKKCVELQNGKIWIDSEFGVGTTFYFTILN